MITNLDRSIGLTMYEIFDTPEGEIMRCVVQSLFHDEREQKLKDRAKQKTFDAISKGNYLYRCEVYKHPFTARKPFLNKYKIS